METDLFNKLDTKIAKVVKLGDSFAKAKEEKNTIEAEILHKIVVKLNNTWALEKISNKHAVHWRWMTDKNYFRYENAFFGLRLFAENNTLYYLQCYGGELPFIAKHPQYSGDALASINICDKGLFTKTINAIVNALDRHITGNLA